MATVAVYGGSFNPPHLGHALAATWARLTEVDRVILVPAADHPFGKALAPHALRLALCRALAEDLGPWCEASAIEEELPRPSYTIATLRALASRRPGDRLRLLVGSDLVPELPRWREWPAIEAEFAPIVVGRTGFGGTGLSMPGVSSTEVRERLAAGEPVDGLVPRAVATSLASSNPYRRSREDQGKGGPRPRSE